MNQIVVIKEGNEIFFILNVKNYDRNFEIVVNEAKEKYSESNGEDLLEDYVVEAIQNSAYDFEYIGFTPIEV